MSDTPDIFSMPSPDRPEKKKEQTPAPAQLKKDPKDHGLGGELLAQAKEAGLNLPAEKMAIMTSFMERAQYGHQGAMPMTCKGLQCPFLNICPIHEAQETLPKGKRCPVEKALIQIWVNKLIVSLQIEVDNPEYAVDMDMVYELASLELIRHRAAAQMADDPQLHKEKIVGYSPQGDPIYDSRVNPSLGIIEKMGKRIDKLREQLLATRREQARLGKLASDNSVRASNILDKARKIAEARQAGNKVQDAEFEVKSNDGEPEKS